MRDMLKPALALGVICLVVGLFLSFAHNMTDEIIAKRIEAEANNARKEVLNIDNDSGFSFIEFKNWYELVGDSGDFENVVDVYTAMTEDSLQGYVITVISNGYGGPMEVMVGISESGRVYGVKVLNSAETPGLGTKATDRSFVSQFVNLPMNAVLKVVKTKSSQENIGEIQAVTGATVSSRAVTSAVQTAINLAVQLESI